MFKRVKSFAALLFSLTLIFTFQQTATSKTIGSINRLDSRLNKIVPAEAALELLAEGFEWSEGPVWIPDGGYLLFSDIPKNTVYKWKEGEGISVFLRPAGLMFFDPDFREPGTNGLMLNINGALTMCDHGNRAIVQLNAENYTRTYLVQRYKGKRLNSPNDLVFDSKGNLYFTDPPYGLKGLNKSPHKELDFNGVYCLTPDKQLVVLTKDLTFPNGIELSPDEKTLYVAVSDWKAPKIMAYDLKDQSISNGRVFFDAAELKKSGKKGSPDGMVMHPDGYLFATGPGGVLVFAPNGDHIGILETGVATANCTLNDDNSF
jgi:gluconolactonase